MMSVDQWVFTALAMIAACGLAVCYIGCLITLLTALGNKRWVWSAGILVLGPIVGLPYVMSQKEADYPRMLMLRGLILLVPAALLIYFKIG